MRNSTLYRRMWYVGKRNIKRMQTINRILLAAIIFTALMTFFAIIEAPILTVFK